MTWPALPSFLTKLFEPPKGPDATSPNAFAKGYEFFGNHALIQAAWLQADAQAPTASAKGLTAIIPLPQGPPPALKRPVVMIPGFSMDASSYSRMSDYLSRNKANGEAVVYDASTRQFRAGADGKGRVLSADEVKDRKMFEIQFSNPFASSQLITLGNNLQGTQHFPIR